MNLLTFEINMEHCGRETLLNVLQCFSAQHGYVERLILCLQESGSENEILMCLKLAVSRIG